MAAHLSHKIRWDFLADYVTPYSDQGITLPVGECGRIHAAKRKHEIQVEMRNYISDDMICTSEDCETMGEKVFRKNNKKKKPFAKGPRDEKKLEMFMESFYNAVHEFASTELKSPAKPVEYEGMVEEKNLSLMYSDRCKCNEFIHFLEFGDKQKLLEYSDSELNDILCHMDGSQAVGNHMQFLFHRIIAFYIVSNVVVYLELRTEDQWPESMKQESYSRRSLLYASGGQTFLPHSRQYLANAMIDVNETRKLSKRLFRAIYLYVMIRMKLDSSYKLRNDFDIWYFRHIT